MGVEYTPVEGCPICHRTAVCYETPLGFRCERCVNRPDPSLGMTVFIILLLAGIVLWVLL
jgi:hypothetical protein